MTARSGPPVLDGYRYVDRLGGGGFADVYRYEQLNLGREVAIKVMTEGFGQAGLESFRREATLMAKLSNHPSIVSIFSSGVAKDGRPFLVMEMCSPGHLGTRIANRLDSVPNVLSIGIQIAGAVETSHRLGILHRDIKPANILFTEFGRPALTDFGISTNGETSAIDKALSPMWAPPEQFGGSGDAVGPTADVYALAATLWAMLVGRSPMEVPGGPNDRLALRQRAFATPPPPTGRADVPASLERVLATAMAKRSRDRYASALEFALALQQVQIEQHHPMTRIDILDEAAVPAAVASSETGTVVSNYVMLDPDPPTSGSGTHTSPQSSGGGQTLTAGPAPGGYVLQHGRGVAQAIKPLDFIGHASPSVVADPTVLRDFKASGGQTPVVTRKRPVLLAASAGVALVAVVAAGGWFAVSSLGAGTTPDTAVSATPRPQDPIPASVPKVTELATAKDGAKVRVTWKNPEPKTGDSFVYELRDPSRSAERHVTADNFAEVDSLPGQTCVAVSLRRANGSLSAEAVVCEKS